MNSFGEPFWRWENGLGNKFCDDVIRFSNTLKKRQGQTRDPTPGANDLTNKRHRDSKIIWMSEKWIYKELLKFVDLANTDAKWNFNLGKAEAIQYTRYDSNNYYHWHVDQVQNDDKTHVRKLSICVNLTDPKDFEGGDFWISIPHPIPEETKNMRLDFMKKRGSVEVFPSYIYHRVTPVISGTRHSLVNWVQGANWK